MSLPLKIWRSLIADPVKLDGKSRLSSALLSKTMDVGGDDASDTWIAVIPERRMDGSLIVTT
jgi:hypothetical protein